jgi:anti-sigma regulatory factor (Ser/Thr protein kinase)
MSAERLSLEIPPDAAQVVTARLFARGIARSLQLDEETSDVLQLALSEICSDMIERRRGGRIAIDVLADGVPMRVRVVSTGTRRDKDDAQRIDAPFRRTLIEALAVDAEFVDERNHLTVSFTLRTP